MWKVSTNPTVQALTLTTRTRRLNLSDLAQVREEGALKCVWCLAPLKGAQRKWCSPICSNSAFAWANPQSEYGLAHLLARQDYKCAGLPDRPCGQDWNPLADSLLGTRGIPKSLDRINVFNIRLIKSLKRQSPQGTKPEVDHIVPIYKGGQSIGFENHQICCSACHKIKSKVDNSGPRVKGPP